MLEKKMTQIKKRPVIGVTTIILSLPVIVWILLVIFSTKNWHPDIFGGFLFVFQGFGIIGGLLLCSGKIYGNYLTICTWIFYFFFEVMRWYQWLIESKSFVMADHTISHFRLFSLLLFIPLSFIFVYILLKDLKKKHNKATPADAKSRAAD
jgi:hypothetical protein